jgi:hypothetical protein
VLAALAEQRQSGGGRHLRLSLARTAHWLLGEEEGEAAGGALRGDPGVATVRPRWEESGAEHVSAVDGDPPLAAVPPPGSLGGRPLRWQGPAGRYGTAEPAWFEPPAQGASLRG